MAAQEQLELDPVVRLVVVDDEPDIVGLVCHRVALDPAIELVGSAPDGTSAMRVIRRTRPDVVLLDVEMPELDGIEVARRLRAEGLDCSICIYSGRLNGSREIDALYAIADAWLLKSAPWDVVRETVLSLRDPEHEGAS
jgi:DNA-binding NarL/FixJ family response regulator